MKSIILRDGVRLAYQEWGNSNSSKKVLALHGWLDNSNTFSYIGNQFNKLDYHCIGVDLLGHGWSGHLPMCTSNYNTPKYISSILQLLETMKWNDNINILSHSMGTGIGLLLAGAFPTKVNKLIMIDGFGPVTYSPDKSSKALHKSLEAEVATYNKSLTSNGPRLYETFSHAVDARINSVSKYPGKQYLSRESAELLVSRGCYMYDEAVDGHGKDNYVHVNTDYSGKVRFRHDQNLMMPSPFYYSNEQLMSFIHDITASNLVIVAEDGWPPGSYANHEERANYLKDKGLFSMVKLPGSHHLHLDPETAPTVFQHVVDFLGRDTSSNISTDSEAITPDGVAV